MNTKQLFIGSRQFLLAFVVILAAQFSAKVVLAQTQRNAIGAAQSQQRDFVFGVNLPWFDGQFNHDLGPQPQHPAWRVWYDGAKVSAYYQDIERIGFQVVRVWLMEGAEGWKVNRNGIITGLDETFLRNLDDLIQRAESENLKLYMCLTSGWKKITYPSPFKDAEQQAAYLENAVRPLARRLKGNETVFAFDVVNEIESQLRVQAGPNRITAKQARDFIRENVKVIKSEDMNRLVSAGSGYHLWKPVQEGFYKDLGLDFYDFHAYTDDGNIPHVRELNVDKPVYIGEFGQRTKNGDDDDLQRKVVSNLMRNAMTKGYAGCFVWAYGPKERYHHLVHTDGRHRPVVQDIHQIITGRDDDFPVGSIWKGNPNFKLTVLERKGKSFKARFESKGWVREVSGAMNNNTISWSKQDVRVIRGNAGGDNEGTIVRDGEGMRIDLVWRGGGKQGTFALRKQD